MSFAESCFAEQKENANGDDLDEHRRNVAVANTLARYDRRPFEILGELVWTSSTTHTTVAVRIEAFELLVEGCR